MFVYSKEKLTSISRPQAPCSSIPSDLAISIKLFMNVLSLVILFERFWPIVCERASVVGELCFVSISCVEAWKLAARAWRTDWARVLFELSFTWIRVLCVRRIPSGLCSFWPIFSWPKSSSKLSPSANLAAIFLTAPEEASRAGWALLAVWSVLFWVASSRWKENLLNWSGERE